MRNQRKELSKTLVELQAEQFDFIIIGGGATGLGCALDATLRGFKTLLLEKDDFASGTSCRSTKLIHGGVRYLEQLDIPLVRESLYERGLLLENASDIVKPLPFLIPSYSFYERPYYYAGLKMYDLLAGSKNIAASSMVSKSETISRFSGIKTDNLKGCIQYYDAQFDDARLALSVMLSTIENGGQCANYCKVEKLLKDKNGKITGVTALDTLNNQELSFNGNCIINASGIFTNTIYEKDQGKLVNRLMTSRGSHIVVKGGIFPDEQAILVPKTKDGRVVFAVPWYGKTIIGTTDILDHQITNNPRITQSEVAYILETANRYLDKKLTVDDITSSYCGLRPLIKPKSNESSKEVSRTHKIEKSDSGIVNILGGKWTTFRAMAEHTVDFALKHSTLPFKECTTSSFRIKDFQKSTLLEEDQLNPDYVIDMVENHMATSIADIVTRRTRLTFLDLERSKEVAADISEFCKEKNIDIDSDMDSYLNFAKAFDFKA